MHQMENGSKLPSIAFQQKENEVVLTVFLSQQEEGLVKNIK